MSVPWNNWYHCNGNTYGTWLHGDPRGWRERKHREHVEGDYKNPPAPSERNDFIHHRSKSLLKKDPVLLTRDQIEFAGAIVVQRLLDAEIELLSFSLDDHHFHLVARFPDHNPRKHLALAKQKAAYLAEELGKTLPAVVTLARLSITEAPGCIATYIPSV